MANTVEEYIIELANLGYITRDQYIKLILELAEAKPLDGTQYKVLKEADEMARKVKGPKKLVRRRVLDEEIEKVVND